MLLWSHSWPGTQLKLPAPAGHPGLSSPWIKHRELGRGLKTAPFLENSSRQRGRGGGRAEGRRGESGAEEGEEKSGGRGEEGGPLPESPHT